MSILNKQNQVLTFIKIKPSENSNLILSNKHDYLSISSKNIIKLNNSNIKSSSDKEESFSLTYNRVFYNEEYSFIYEEIFNPSLENDLITLINNQQDCLFLCHGMSNSGKKSLLLGDKEKDFLTISQKGIISRVIDSLILRKPSNYRLFYSIIIEYNNKIIDVSKLNTIKSNIYQSDDVYSSIYIDLNDDLIRYELKSENDYLQRILKTMISLYSYENSRFQVYSKSNIVINLYIINEKNEEISTFSFVINQKSERVYKKKGENDENLKLNIKNNCDLIEIYKYLKDNAYYPITDSDFNNQSGFYKEYKSKLVYLLRKILKKPNYKTVIIGNIYLSSSNYRINKEILLYINSYSKIIENNHNKSSLNTKNDYDNDDNSNQNKENPIENRLLLLKDKEIQLLNEKIDVLNEKLEKSTVEMKELTEKHHLTIKQYEENLNKISNQLEFDGDIRVLYDNNNKKQGNSTNRKEYDYCERNKNMKLENLSLKSKVEDLKLKILSLEKEVSIEKTMNLTYKNTYSLVNEYIKSRKDEKNPENLESIFKNNNDLNRLTVLNENLNKQVTMLKEVISQKDEIIKRLTDNSKVFLMKYMRKNFVSHERDGRLMHLMNKRIENIENIYRTSIDKVDNDKDNDTNESNSIFNTNTINTYSNSKSNSNDKSKRNDINQRLHHRRPKNDYDSINMNDISSISNRNSYINSNINTKQIEILSSPDFSYVKSSVYKEILLIITGFMKVFDKLQTKEIPYINKEKGIVNKKDLIDYSILDTFISFSKLNNLIQFLNSFSLNNTRIFTENLNKISSFSRFLLCSKQNLYRLYDNINYNYGKGSDEYDKSSETVEGKYKKILVDQKKKKSIIQEKEGKEVKENPSQSNLFLKSNMKSIDKRSLSSIHNKTIMRKSFN